MLSEANDVSGRCPHYWTHHQTSALCDGVQGSPGSGQEVRFSQDCRWFTGQVRFTVCVKVYFMNWFKLTRPFTLPVTPGIQTSNYRASEGWSTGTWKTRLKHVLSGHVTRLVIKGTTETTAPEIPSTPTDSQPLVQQRFCSRWMKENRMTVENTRKYSQWPPGGPVPLVWETLV